jgi:hypothetical protein
MSITLRTIAPQTAYSVTIKEPYYQYETTIRMGLHYSRTNTGYKIGDDGSYYDSRICEIQTWLLSAEHQLALDAMFRNVDFGRGANFQLELGTNSGFYPFGADKGDSNNFIVSLYGYDYKGAQLNPYLQHLNTIRLVYVSGPDVAYTPPSPEAEGVLSIGTVSTLRPVQSFPQVNDEMSIVRNISRSGVVSSVDMGTSADVCETDLDLELRTGNCAALISYLLSTRSGDVSVSAPLNTWLFGINNGSSGEYITKLLSNEIKITHDNFDLFKTRLKLWMKSAHPGTIFNETVELEGDLELDGDMVLA